MKAVKSGAVRLIIYILVSVMLISGMSVFAHAEKPEITASEGAYLYCMESDTALYSKNENEKFNPGVLTKLMVAVVAIEEAENRGMNLDSEVVASRKAITNAHGKHIAMKVGEKFRLRDMISAIIHSDADDCANVIAENIADNTENFVALMNVKAKDLGMTQTEYFSVTGTYDSASYTTPADQAKLAACALKIHSLCEIALQIRVVIDVTNKSPARYYGTTNYLVSSRVYTDYYMQSATGFLCGSNTEAGYCGILTSRKDGLNYIAVVMNSDSKTIEVSPEREETDEKGNTITVPAEYKTIYLGLHEAKALLKYGENSFGYIKAVNTATPITDIPVKLASGTDRVALLPEYNYEIFVPDGIDKEKEITYTYKLEKTSLTAPVKAGQRVGTLYLSYQGNVVAEIPLITKNNIEENGYLVLLTRIEELLSTPFVIVLILLTVFAAVFYVLANAITRQKKIALKMKEEERKRGYRLPPKESSSKNSLNSSSKKTFSRAENGRRDGKR